MRYCGYAPESYAEWRAILAEKLRDAKEFEIHCWRDEAQWGELAARFGAYKATDWDGIIVQGPVSDAFAEMLLRLGEPADQKDCPKRTPFFSIFLNTGFSSEHYGTELNEV